MPRLSDSDGRPAFMRLREDASSWLSLANSDIACQTAHYASLLAHLFVIGVGFYAFVSCGSDLGFTDDQCSGNSSRVGIAWGAGAVVRTHPRSYFHQTDYVFSIDTIFRQAMFTLPGSGIPLARLTEYEKRDSESASHENRVARMTMVGLCLFFSVIFMILDFVMMGKTISLSAGGRWFPLMALGYMEMLAGYVCSRRISVHDVSCKTRR